MPVLSRALVLLLSARTAFGEEAPPLDEVPPVDSANFTAISLMRFACNPTMGFMYLDGQQQAVADELNCTDLVDTALVLPPVVGATCPAGFECSPIELGMPCGQGQCRPCSHGMYCPAGTANPYSSYRLNSCPAGMNCPAVMTEGVEAPLGRRAGTSGENCTEGNFCVNMTFDGGVAYSSLGYLLSMLTPSSGPVSTAAAAFALANFAAGCFGFHPKDIVDDPGLSEGGYGIFTVLPGFWSFYALVMSWATASPFGKRRTVLLKMLQRDGYLPGTLVR